MVLVPVEGGRPLALDKAIVFFGRGPECDVVLNTSRKVSRKHCCVAQIDDYFVVRDLGSMNGVRINEDAVEGEQRLAPGDVLWVGDLGFRLEMREAVAKQAGNGSSPSSRNRKQPRRIDPKMLSQDLPVAIPEEDGVDFQVEKSRAQPAIPDDEIIELGDSDIIE
jgi:pSer/pThr/pTyr-binding forkhead associated (FHA) protein